MIELALNLVIPKPKMDIIIFTLFFFNQALEYNQKYSLKNQGDMILTFILTLPLYLFYYMLVQQIQTKIKKFIVLKVKDICSNNVQSFMSLEDMNIMQDWKTQSLLLIFSMNCLAFQILTIRMVIKDEIFREQQCLNWLFISNIVSF